MLVVVETSSILVGIVSRTLKVQTTRSIACSFVCLFVHVTKNSLERARGYKALIFGLFCVTILCFFVVVVNNLFFLKFESQFLFFSSA